MQVLPMQPPVEEPHGASDSIPSLNLCLHLGAPRRHSASPSPPTLLPLLLGLCIQLPKAQLKRVCGQPSKMPPGPGGARFQAPGSNTEASKQKPTCALGKGLFLIC